MNELLELLLHTDEVIMRLVAERLEAVESIHLAHTNFADETVFIPDTVPADLVSSFDSELAGSL